MPDRADEPQFDCADLIGCAACGSADVSYDPADGYVCHSCGASDADE